jgi:hypothetical protein
LILKTGLILKVRVTLVVANRGRVGRCPQTNLFGATNSDFLLGMCYIMIFKLESRVGRCPQVNLFGATTSSVLLDDSIDLVVPL